MEVTIEHDDGATETLENVSKFTNIGGGRVRVYFEPTGSVGGQLAAQAETYEAQVVTAKDE